MIRPAKIEDAAVLADLYNHYIRETTVTFEESAISPEEMSGRLSEVLDAGLPWLVWEDKDGIHGFAYAGKWKGRCAYRYSVETTVYLHPEYTGQGIGSALYKVLLDDLIQRNFHVAIAGIAMPNPGSQGLHEKFDFRKVAHFSEVGFKFDRWIDVEYWQRELSAMVGL